MRRRDFFKNGIAASAVISILGKGVASAAPTDASITLNVQFDIRQASQQLNWYFSDSRGKISPKTSGLKSGLLAFRSGDTLGVAITVDSEAGQLASARIVDCNMITLPLANTWEMEKPGHYPMPSPFYRTDSGPGVISSFMPVNANTATTHRQTFTGTPLTIMNNGRYKLTFMLTVAITDVKGATSHRVFYFDPEADVGTGLE